MTVDQGKTIGEMTATFKPVAEHGLLVSFADDFSQEANDAVAALDHLLATHPIAGIVETVPAFVNILVSFDPLQTDHNTLQQKLMDRIKGMGGVTVNPKTHFVQVCYEPPFDPDLKAVANATGLTEQAVINAHLAGDYAVVMYGFAPGYAYLGGVPEAIQIPRKTAPVRDIPAGSVMIAGAQCLVTTLVMPTGWSIIGRSPTQILLDDPAKPFLFDVADKVQFERIDLRTFEQLSKGQGHG